MQVSFGITWSAFALHFAALLLAPLSLLLLLLRILRPEWLDAEPQVVRVAISVNLASSPPRFPSLGSTLALRSICPQVPVGPKHGALAVGGELRSSGLDENRSSPPSRSASLRRTSTATLSNCGERLSTMVPQRPGLQHTLTVSNHDKRRRISQVGGSFGGGGGGGGGGRGGGTAAAGGRVRPRVVAEAAPPAARRRLDPAKYAALLVLWVLVVGVWANLFSLPLLREYWERHSPGNSDGAATADAAGSGAARAFQLEPHETSLPLVWGGITCLLVAILTSAESKSEARSRPISHHQRRPCRRLTLRSSRPHHDSPSIWQSMRRSFDRLANLAVLVVTGSYASAQDVVVDVQAQLEAGSRCFQAHAPVLAPDLVQPRVASPDLACALPPASRSSSVSSCRGASPPPPCSPRSACASPTTSRSARRCPRGGACSSGRAWSSGAS